MSVLEIRASSRHPARSKKRLARAKAENNLVIFASCTAGTFYARGTGLRFGPFKARSDDIGLGIQVATVVVGVDG
jgi:hypothetical protein